MNRIKDKFIDLKSNNKKALVSFITAGDPDISSSLEVLKALIKGGVDLIELGVPFSDPTADGPVIQRSSQRALKSGVNLEKVINLVAKIRKEHETPIILFSYYNPIISYGISKFYNDSVKVGVDGLLIVDLPPEESNELLTEWPGNEISLIRLVAPTTSQERMKSILKSASGFIYLISMTGVTGGIKGFDASEIANISQNIKKTSPLPVCIGFGISKPNEVSQACEISDGAVVGSAFERIIENNLNSPDMPQLVYKLAKELKDATNI